MEEKLAVSDPSKIEITKITGYTIHFDYEGKHYFIKECNGFEDEGNVMILFSKENEVVHFMKREDGYASRIEDLTGRIKTGVPYSKFAAFGYLDTFVKNCKDNGLFC